jgi:hypothetical protein
VSGSDRRERAAFWKHITELSAKCDESEAMEADAPLTPSEQRRAAFNRRTALNDVLEDSDAPATASISHRLIVDPVPAVRKAPVAATSVSSLSRRVPVERGSLATLAAMQQRSVSLVQFAQNARPSRPIAPAAAAAAASDDITAWDGELSLVISDDEDESAQH